ncbi:MAG: DUF4359 domain-containing protein [Oscillatoria sp. PMC 1051.18]|nr:DUF4359 domain-containing protein [Oscillatoria sp. PMC 1050.18]MEC5030461.1 DUF4359 domain-containing protein [Oscillatoria sp. PMC 1051.18]
MLKSKWGKGAIRARRVGGAIALTLLSGVMVATNPNQQAYAEYASEKLVSQIKDATCQQRELPQFLQGVFDGAGDICRNAIASSGNVVSLPIQAIVNRTTKRQNFVILSVYTTELPNTKITSLGAFGNFITF